MLFYSEKVYAVPFSTIITSSLEFKTTFKPIFQIVLINPYCSIIIPSWWMNPPPPRDSHRAVTVSPHEHWKMKQADTAFDRESAKEPHMRSSIKKKNYFLSDFNRFSGWTDRLRKQSKWKWNGVQNNPNN